jgi:heme-degrading monooxygenase HmoA
MYARVTQLEVDTVRTSVGDAVDLFRNEVLPMLREQAGYQGVDVLTTDEGQALLVSFWDTAEHAQADAERGFYAEVLARYVTLFRSPPGRERYEVRLIDRVDAPSSV